VVRAMMDAQHQTPDAAEKFSHVVRARAPRAFCDVVQTAAETEQIPISEFVRRAVAERVNRTLQSGDAGDVPASRTLK